MPLNVLISGGGIAGPAVAFWLARLGHKCTIVERAERLRANGQQIDLRLQGLEAITRMGLLDDLKNIRVDERGLQFVDASGKVQAAFGVDHDNEGLRVASAEYEFMRGDLCKLLYDRTKDLATYRFGVMVETFENTDEDVKVTFSDGTKGTYDLLIAADGQGSRIRRKLLSDDEVNYRSLGVFGCFYTLPRQPADPSIAQVYNAPGGHVLLTRWHSPSQGQGYLLTMAQPETLRAALKEDMNTQKKVWAEMFGGAGWQADRLVKAMWEADDCYSLEIAQIRAKRWSKGRVVLLGDAGFAPSPLTGMGTTVAMTSACVLAGEISTIKVGDEEGGSESEELRAALERYEEQLRPWVATIQNLPPGVPRIAYPTSQWGIKVTHWVLWAFATLGLDRLVARLTPSIGGSFKIPEYPELARAIP